MDTAELARRFRYHAPGPRRQRIHNDLRDQFLGIAHNLNTALVGESREKSLVMTAIEEASFWAHAHVARNIEEDPTDG
jgi:hypothetical protein